jgi:hypothetical protein
MMPKKPNPTQREADLNDPEEHFVWALRSMPTRASSGVLIPAAITRGWSRHLWDCGFRHRDWLAGLADEGGNINVSQLPEQTAKFQEAFRGPHHTYNPAAQWVKPGAQVPQPYVIPNIKEMTVQEKYALAYQLKQDGVVIPDAHKPSVAKVEGT